MALVLCTGVDRGLMQTRTLLLERAGHTVVQASSEPEVVAACAHQCFDVAVIGQSLGNMKQHVFTVLKEHCPNAKVRELVDAYQKPKLPQADDWLETHSAAPAELPERVARLASGTQTGK